MKIKIIILTVFAAILSASSLIAVPHEIQFQGRLTDNSGNPVPGSSEVRFEIKAGDGTLLWRIDKEVDANESGLFSEVLGDFTELEKFSQHEEYYLHISIKAPGGSSYHALEPPQKLASVPFSFQSVNSEKAELAIEIEPDKITTDKILDGEVMEDDLKKPVIEAEHLKDESVTGRALAGQSVDAIHIKDSSIGGYKLVESTITTRELKDGSVDRIDIAPDAITSSLIEDGSIQAADMAENAVASETIIDNTIKTADILDGTITVDDLAQVLLAKLIPEKMVALFAGQCPDDGWKRFDKLDDRLPLGRPTFTGALGGNPKISGLTLNQNGNHSHTVDNHSHPAGTLTTNPSSQTECVLKSAGGHCHNLPWHKHSIGGSTDVSAPGTSDSEQHNHLVSSDGSWLPPYVGMVYCEKL